ncbi:MAG: domain containing protein [Flavipsychrobacter sp.]|jgi:hypothetical protein|nr:domain containing protein [Flavipsychrobacter sp.]
MKKYLLLIVVLLCSQLNKTYAQKLRISPDSLFYAPDTVCINQPVTVLPDTAAFNALSYYWGFCSGYLMNAPTGRNMGDSFGFHIPANIDIVNDSGIYYGFVVNARTNEFLRLNFGTDLTNKPTVTNFGNLEKGLPINPTSLFILKDTFSREWHIFVTGGFEAATSSIARIDFGMHLSNPKPNIANFGDHFGVLNYPKGIFVAQDANNQWFGYVVNHNTNNLIRLDFSYNVSNTPKVFDYGNPKGSLLQSPTDIAGILDNGKWYLFITNTGVSSFVSRIDLDTTLAPDYSYLNDPSGSSEKIRSDPSILPADPSPTTFNFRIDQPSSIVLTRDCGAIYAYVTDSTTSQLISIQMASVTGTYTAIDYNTVGGMRFPSCISSILRNKTNDDLYGFIVNPGDSTLTRINIEQCHHSTIPSFTESKPPVYSYDSPGVYNIYFVINQGTPTMRVDCKEITVLKYPPIAMNQDTTICQGDTIRVYAVSTLADSFRWQNGYNIDTTYLYRDSAKVFPDYSHTYNITIYYPFGCIIDTAVRVHVSKVMADAGPDRYIRDGATSIIGGPFTTLAGLYKYHWEPFQFMSDSTVPNPYVFPPHDMTYHLTVTELNDTFGCVAKDTVVVRVDCGDFAVPNAFAPASPYTAVSTFGILNKALVKLNYFRVYNRWGTLVFETTNPTLGWDGTYADKPCEQGVYVWEADGFCITGKRIKKHGNVTLLR